MTGSGSENWCTLYMHTRPTPTAMTATSGIQTRASTVLPTERGLTRSPFGTRSPDLVFSSPHHRHLEINQVDMRPSRRYQLLNGRDYYDAERYHLRPPSAALA